MIPPIIAKGRISAGRDFINAAPMVLMGGSPSFLALYPLRTEII
jgi:hypothetical protein